MRIAELEKAYPFPWRHEARVKGMSAVVAANGNVVTGSLISQQFHAPTATRQAHALMVKLVNEAHPVGKAKTE